MRIIIVDTPTELAKTTVTYLTEVINQPTTKNIALTAGTSPLETYERFIPAFRRRLAATHLPELQLWNFDEVPRHGQQIGATTAFLQKHLLSPANFAPNQFHYLNETNWATWDQTIQDAGGLDFMLLGLGTDGHYAGNLPGTTSFASETSFIAKDATPAVYEALLAEVNGDESQLPDGYVTMGPKTIQTVKEIALMAFGKKKAQIVREAFFGPVTESIPASLLQQHANFTLLLDRDAASEILVH